MKKKAINYSLPIEFSKNLERVNANLSKCRARICYGDKNRNYTCFEDVKEQLEKSLIYTPIKAIWEDEKKDFCAHGYKTEGKIYGIVPAETSITYEENDEEDGTLKRYMACDVYLFTGLYTEANYIAGKGLSLELNPKTCEGKWIEDENGDEYFRFSKAEFQALQVLGDDVEPCFGGAAFYEKLIRKEEEDKRVKVTKREDGFYELVDGESKLFLCSINESEIELLKNTSVSDIQAKYTTVEAEKTELTEKYSTIEAEKNDLTEKYSTIETEKAELETKYSTLETEKAELETQYSTLKVEKEELTAKYSVLENDRIQKENKDKEDLFAKYSNLLAEEYSEQLETLKTKSTNYSVEDIKKELSYLYTQANESILFGSNTLYAHTPQNSGIEADETLKTILANKNKN